MKSMVDRQAVGKVVKRVRGALKKPSGRVAAAMALGAILVSCRPAKATPAVECVFDEAFAALFPSYVDEVAGAFAADGREAKANPVPVSAIGTTLDRLLSAQNETASRSAAIIASPLVAARYLERDKGPAQPLLIVPFAGEMAKVSPEILPIEYDYPKAYAEMGRRAAMHVQEYIRKGFADASCSIVFQENFMRGADALASFISAYESAAGKGHLSVQATQPDAASVDMAGSVQSSVGQVLLPHTRVLVLAIDNPAIAEEAARNARGLVLIADGSGWGVSKSDEGLFHYFVSGNEKGLARETERRAKAAMEKGPVPKGARVSLPFRSTSLKKP